ncbi:porin [Chromobacterium amazonense]|uniref:porin n=1 Tax=Chromobacterium amazonense TaxID=1382803 RepID=UPI000582CBC9|nr:porin [Chromobacterium amazonense]KIA80481.1 porin [Chromobacterium piscinae]MBM2883624.1 porin [Chromobacterium amazonense]MDE1712213.1 porin [Chromobacterium amazonense]
MQKKNLAALVASLFIVPVAAHADVTIYGFLSAGIESTKASTSASASSNNGVTFTPYNTRTRIVDHNSRIGFKGNEDLGNGLKAIWQVESSLRNFEQGGTNDAGQSATLGTRNTFVGLESADFGKVLLGNYDSAYKTLSGSSNSALGIDVMVNTTADNFGKSSVNGRGEERLKNSVQWYSPKWSGFQLGASWGVDEARVTDQSAPSNGSATDAKRLSLGLAYNWQSLNLSTGWDRRYDSAVSGNSNSVKTGYSGKNVSLYNIAGSYKFDFGTYIGGVYEWATYDNAAGAQLKQDDWQIALGQDFGAASIKLAYGQLGSLKNVSAGTNGDDYKAKQWILGGTYNLSKTTQLLAYYTKITNNAKANANFANNPVYDTINSADASKNTLGAGSSPQAFGLGMKVAF